MSSPCPALLFHHLPYPEPHSRVPPAACAPHLTNRGCCVHAERAFTTSVRVSVCLCPRPQPRYLPKCPSESKSRSEPGAMAGRPQAASLQRRCPEETPGAARPLPSAPFTVPAPVPIPIPVPAPAGPRCPPRPCPGPPSPSPGPARRKVAAEGRPPNGRAPTVAARRQPSLGRLHTPPEQGAPKLS